MGNENIDSMVINWFLGHDVGEVNRAYFVQNPDKLKEQYVKLVPDLTVLSSVNTLDIKSPEYLRLEREKNELESNVELAVKKGFLKELERLRSSVEGETLEELIDFYNKN